MNTEPTNAAPRTDLPFLRHRALTKPARTGGGAAVGDFFAGRGTNPHHAHATPAPASPPSLTPAATGVAAPASARPTASLDLDAPAQTSPQPPTVTPSSSLDLDAMSSQPSAPVPTLVPSVQHGEPGPGRRVAAVARVAEGGHRLLGVKSPTVTLTRVQSGVGALTFVAVCSAAAGDLRIGCAYQLGSGVSSTVQLAGGSRFAPPGSRRPVIIAQREEYEQLTIDLRQVADLQRAVIYAFSDSGIELTWAGTLVATTFGGARIELPLDPLYKGKVAVLLSIVNVGGELWLRAEMETVAGSIRDAVRAYGFDRITWRDDRTPAD